VSLREGPLFQRVWEQRSLIGQRAGSCLQPRLGPHWAMTCWRQSVARAPCSPPRWIRYRRSVVRFSTTLVDDYMVKVDRASMMNSLEVRAPFLDANLIDFAFTKNPFGVEVRRPGNPTHRATPGPQVAATGAGHRSQAGLFRAAGCLVSAGWPEAVRERLADLPEAIDRKMVEAQIQGHMAGRANGARLFALVMLSACSGGLPSAMSPSARHGATRRRGPDGPAGQPPGQEAGPDPWGVS